jgi:hypothetical protein
MSQLLEFFQWLLYSTLIPLLPVPLVWLGTWLRGIDRSVFTILRNGQLCFYSTTLSATTIRDILLRTPAKNHPLSSVFIGVLIFFIILSTFLYGVAATTSQTESEDSSNVNLPNNRLAWISILAAFTTTIMVAIARKNLGLLS